MNPGDRILIHMHDTPAGFQVNLVDLSTRPGRFDDRLDRQRVRPHPVHAELDAPARRRRTPSTRSTRPPTRAGTRGAPTPTTSRCRTRSGTSRTASRSTRSSTAPCPGARTPAASTRTTATTSASPGPTRRWCMIDGCFSDDDDWDGQSYRADWPGTNPNPFVDRALHPTPVLFTSPVTVAGEELLDDRVRDRSPQPRGRRRRTTHRSATRPPARTASTRPTGPRSTRSSRPGSTTAPASGSRAGTSSPARSTTSVAARTTEYGGVAERGLPGARLHDGRAGSRTSTAETGPTPVRSVCSRTYVDDSDRSAGARRRRRAPGASPRRDTVGSWSRTPCCSRCSRRSARPPRSKRRSSAWGRRSAPAYCRPGAGCPPSGCWPTSSGSPGRRCARPSPRSSRAAS